jgi:hypothetical protein
VTPRLTTDKPYTPDTLIDDVIGLRIPGISQGRFPFERSAFVGAMVAFGPLPKCGQGKLIDCLIKLYTLNQSFKPIKSVRIIPSRVRDRIKNIETTTGRLLSLLGINKKGADFLRRCELHGPASDRSDNINIAIEDMLAREAWLHLATGGAAGTAITHLQAYSRAYPGLPIQLPPQDPGFVPKLPNLIFELLWLQQWAETVAGEVCKRISAGRGGARARPTPEGKLIRETIAVYVIMRREYPKSGHKPGYGGPLCRFVRAVADLCRMKVADPAIREVWRSIQKLF